MALEIRYYNANSIQRIRHWIPMVFGTPCIIIMNTVIGLQDYWMFKIQISFLKRPISTLFAIIRPGFLQPFCVGFSPQRSGFRTNVYIWDFRNRRGSDICKCSWNNIGSLKLTERFQIFDIVLHQMKGCLFLGSTCI